MDITKHIKQINNNNNVKFLFITRSSSSPNSEDAGDISPPIFWIFRLWGQKAENPKNDDFS